MAGRIGDVKCQWCDETVEQWGEVGGKPAMFHNDAERTWACEGPRTEFDTPAQIGDVVLAHSKGPFGVLIRFGQWLRPSWRPYRYWNHAAIVTNIRPDGTVRCTQMGRKCDTVDLKDVAPNGHVTIRPAPPGMDRLRAIEYALSQVGVNYSIATILSIALSLLTPSAVRFDFRRHGDALICSALVARSWEHGGWFCPADPFQITPAEIARATSPV